MVITKKEMKDKSITISRTINLTKREEQVAKAILVYGNMKKAAHELDLTIGTDAFHCANLRLKFNAPKTILAVVEAHRYGLI